MCFVPVHYQNHTLIFKLLSPSCFGLRKLVNICESFGIDWDIKFNTPKSQLATFGGKNPSGAVISLNGLPMPWVNSVKYLGVYFLCNSGKNEWSHNIRRFYGQFNNIMSVLGKGRNEITDIHLLKAYCLPTLMNGCENSSLCDSVKRKITLSGIIGFVIFFMLLVRQCETFAVLLPLSATVIPY